MQIRKAKKSDLNQVVSIFVAEYTKSPYNEKWTLASARKKLSYYLKDYKMYAAIEDNELVGFTVFRKRLWLGTQMLYIDELVVAAQHSGKGIGSTLLKFVEEKCKENKVSEVYLLADKGADALDFYAKRNYKETGLVIMKKQIR